MITYFLINFRIGPQKTVFTDQHDKKRPEKK